MTAPHLQPRTTAIGGRFDFDDGGTYCGGWADGKAHGHGVCTGPKGQGEYSGSWHFGFEVSGVYTWPSGSTFEGQWQNGKRHGLGVETRGRWVYRGEWTQGLKGRYGVRQSLTSGAKYEGTWANGLQDGYGSEMYADGGIYQGQWFRGLRHGYGVRTSAPFGLASLFRPRNLRASMTSLQSEQEDPASERDRKIDDSRGGFVLKAKSDEPLPRRRSLVERSSNLKKSIIQTLRLKKQRSTGDIDRRGASGSVRSTGSTTSSASSGSTHSAKTRTSGHTDSNVSFVSQDDIIDASVVETYMGEWKNDKRCGFGISERSDGLKYEGEWYNNMKYGYGITSFKDGSKEEGKYKNNFLMNKKHLVLFRSAKFRERIDGAVNAAARASQVALQKADIAISRTATARGKSELAGVSAVHAKEDSDFSRIIAKQYSPEFHQPGTEILKKKLAHNKESPQSNQLQSPSSTAPSQNVHQRTLSLFVPQDNSLASNVGEYGQKEPVTLDPSTTNTDRCGSHTTFRGNPPAQEPRHASQNSVSYLDPSSTFMGNEPINRKLRGSLRRQNHLSFGEGNYTVQRSMSDHFDQYTQETATIKPQFCGSQFSQNFSKSQAAQPRLNLTHQPTSYAPTVPQIPGFQKAWTMMIYPPGTYPVNLHSPAFMMKAFRVRVILDSSVSHLLIARLVAMLA
ncbi:junctophilin-1-like [Tachypleus tridentatus]|uniref:junctophilin-1-like n=1 Tax=Tachypleus tridentatus TaxID=6853 RepID=UPI003FD66B6A